MVTSGRTFQDVVKHAKNLEGVKWDFYVMFLKKKARKGGGFRESFTK